MSKTVENQKWFRIHKPSLKSPFLQVAHADWMRVNKDLGPYGLQLYLYLAGNADGYEFGLSPQAARNQADIKETSFRKYLKLLEKNGYIVWRRGNVYDFYTSPRPEDERTDPDHHEAFISFEDSPDAQESTSQRPSATQDNSTHAPQIAPQSPSTRGDVPMSQGDTAISSGVQNPSPYNREINNRYNTNIINNEKNNITDNAGETPAPPADAADAAPATIGKAVEIVIPPPKSKYIEKLEKDREFFDSIHSCIDPITGEFRW